MRAATELYPCPFCGGAGKIETDGDASYVTCAGGEFPKFLTGTTGCGATIMRANPIQAAEAWNARVKLDTECVDEITRCENDEKVTTT